MKTWQTGLTVEQKAVRMFRCGYMLDQIAETLQITLQRLKEILRRED